MKVIYIILILFISYSRLDPLSPLQVSNPAELAAYYYSWQGGELGFFLPEKDFKVNPKIDISIYRYTPSREGFNLLAGAGYKGISSKPFVKAGLAKRYSEMYYGGTIAETGYDFNNNTYNFNNTTSMIYKHTGNLDYTFTNRIETAFGGGIHLKNRVSATAGLNIDRQNRFCVSLNTAPGLGVSWKAIRSGVVTNIALDFERLLRSKSRINLTFSLGLSRGDNRIGTKIYAANHYRQTFSYEMRYGHYQPPITYSPTIFPITKQESLHYGLSLMKMIDYIPTSDIVITVRRGDYLNRISQNLPDTADESFRNNITAIARYNDIRPPYTIHPGQRLKVPPKITAIDREDLPQIDEIERERIKEAVSIARTSDLMETRLSAALWAYLLDGKDEMMALLPVRADIENKYLLNTQALAEVELRNPKTAIRKLRFAIDIDPSCPILNTNLAVAYILDNDLKNAELYLVKGIELSQKNGMDTSFHKEVLEQIAK